MEWFGFLPGKRESRRFVGRHILSEGDIFKSRAFPDAIAYGGWPIDTHPPEGIDAPELPPCEQHHLPYLYDIPLRACVSAGPANLMFAGRNISATHIAFASTRVMATCAAVGQGVGTAAVFALRAGVTPAVAAELADLWPAIQQQLVKDDCYLVGVRNEDPADLVRKAAAITASSDLPGAEAGQIRSGQTRAIHGRPLLRPADLSGNLWDEVIRETAAGGRVRRWRRESPRIIASRRRCGHVAEVGRDRSLSSFQAGQISGPAEVDCGGRRLDARSDDHAVWLGHE